MADKVLCDKSDLVNIADAVRSKLGVTDTYYVSELSSAIQNIQTGGITPSGTISITENGTVDVSQYANAEVNVSATPSLQSKSVTYTENGAATITPDEGYDGLSSVDVTVNVSGGGGGGSVGAVPLLSGSTQALPDGSDGVNFGNVYDIFSAYESSSVVFVMVARNNKGDTTSIRAYYRHNFELTPASNMISIGADIDIVNYSLYDLTVHYPAHGKISIYCAQDL